MAASYGPLLIKPPTGASTTPEVPYLYDIVRDEPNLKRSVSVMGAGSNLEGALQVYRLYLSNNTVFVLAVLSMFALILALLATTLSERVDLFRYARFLHTA